MIANPKQYAKALFSLINEVKSDKEAKEIIKKFVEVLIKNNKISQIEKIISYFVELWDKEKNIMQAEIINAEEVGKEVEGILSNYLKKKIGDKKIFIKKTVDKNILGGFIIKYDNKILDASLATKIKELKGKLLE